MKKKIIVKTMLSLVVIVGILTVLSLIDGMDKIQISIPKIVSLEDDKNLRRDKDTNLTSESAKIPDNDSAKKTIKIYDIDGKGKKYTFSYKNESYTATYTKDNWHIVDSYKIEDYENIKEICQALIDIHPIHGRDMVSYRTAEDMAYEWMQHNIAYQILPEGSQWRNHAKDVDLDPEDQGKSLQEMYKSRINKTR